MERLHFTRATKTSQEQQKHRDQLNQVHKYNYGKVHKFYKYVKIFTIMDRYQNADVENLRI